MSDAAATKPIAAETRLSFTDSLRILQNHLHEAPHCDVATWHRRFAGKRFDVTRSDPAATAGTHASSNAK